MITFHHSFMELHLIKRIHIQSEGELIQYDLDDRSTSYASGMDAFTIRKDPLLDLTRTMNMGDADGQSTKKHGTISLVMRQLDY